MSPNDTILREKVFEADARPGDAQPSFESLRDALAKTLSQPEAEQPFRLEATPPEPIKYLMAELQVDRKNHAAFRLKSPIVAQQMLDLFHWELVYAAYPISGKVNRFVHIWRIPEESSVLRIMTAGSLDNGGELHAMEEYPNDLVGRFKFAYREVQELIGETRHVLMSSLPHDPAYIGYQQLTVLVDAEGELFTIDHDVLRQQQEWTEATERLQKIRAEKRRVERLSSPLRGMQNGRRAAGEVLRERRKQTAGDSVFERLDELLSYGATAGELKSANGQRELFFNLAELKPLSIFQQKSQSRKRNGIKLKLETHDGEVDVAANAVVIAAPWGGIYRLNREQLEEVSEPVAPDLREGTWRRVQPLLEAKVNLAAIPEERDLLIGDGCQCYVINLNSFCRSAGKTRARPSKGTDRA